jgi:hypothetical protein
MALRLRPTETRPYIRLNQVLLETISIANAANIQFPKLKEPGRLIALALYVSCFVYLNKLEFYFFEVGTDDEFRFGDRLHIFGS